MFSSVSWTAYLTVIGFLLIFYYLVVVVKFYWSELQSLLKGNSSLGPSTNRSVHFQYSEPEPFPSPQPYVTKVEEVDKTFEKVEELTSKLKEVIANAASTNSAKEDFIQSLQALFKNYHFLKGSAFLVAINNLIASECEKHGFIYLSGNEQMMLWN